MGPSIKIRTVDPLHKPKSNYRIKFQPLIPWESRENHAKPWDRWYQCFKIKWVSRDETQSYFFIFFLIGILSKTRVWRLNRWFYVNLEIFVKDCGPYDLSFFILWPWISRFELLILFLSPRAFMGPNLSPLFLLYLEEFMKNIEP